ncbi:MAG: YidC/Oxa1 family membrane protein insertase [Patescibacteria group bacterium]
MFTTLLVQPLANGLILFYRLLGSDMGLAIIGFSVFLRLILNPLTRPYLESMKKMKEIAPNVEKLKKKHKGNKVKFTQAQADLYKQKGINPGAGCVPYIIQIVILIAFFNVFTKTLSADGDPTTLFNELLYPFLQFGEGQVINTWFLYLDVAVPDTIGIPGLPFGLPGPILILAAAVQFLSAKITAPYERVQEAVAEKTPGAADDITSAMQKSMVFTFPLFTLIIGLNFPSGLALYWLMFSLIQAYQQYRTQGWGGLTPWIERLGLIKFGETKK